ncbi:MAG TPA: response regulator, partial [Rugosimonospora sp.]|nr:response regulator [Rugosimonospora sp.]
GKPDEGRVELDVTRRGRRIAFTCRDDGRGFDIEALRRAVRARGRADTASLEPGALLELVSRGGISTAETLSEVSGRGVGLDAAREAAARLGGALSVGTDPGRGAVVEVVVPLSLMAVECLLVQAAGVTAGVPLDCVRHSLRRRSDEVAYTSSGASVPYDGRAVPYLPLAPLIAPPRPVAPRTGFLLAVVVETAGGTVAVGVDRLLGTAEVVVRPIPDLAPANPAVGGLFLDGEGVPRAVLDPEGLVAEARLAPPIHSGPATPAQRRPILVIDDSLTTRMLERSILESAGYRVEVAASAEEGMDKAHAGEYGLFLVDIEMPGMDGFTFVARTRADPVLREIPAILVSSRASAEDRQRGIAAGACLHVAKSEFNQKELLERIAELVR